jgi:hypothetical protein
MHMTFHTHFLLGIVESLIKLASPFMTQSLHSRVQGQQYSHCISPGYLNITASPGYLNITVVVTSTKLDLHKIVRKGTVGRGTEWKDHMSRLLMSL